VARSGDTYLEIIFGDAGSGTLDQEVLDEAIKALLELQSSGRLVGLSLMIRSCVNVLMLYRRKKVRANSFNYLFLFELVFIFGA
jgi:hypothetical protein